MINQSELMAVFNKHRGDAVVVTCMSASRAWAETSDTEDRDLPIRPMGKAVSIAFGVAVARPKVKVVLFDGDGSLLMNLGTLATIATKRPENFVHFVMENGVYAITGGQPVPGKDMVSFAGLAKDAGYAESYDFDNLEDFAVSIEDIMKKKGPTLINIKTVPEIQTLPPGLRPQSRRRPWEAGMHSLKETLAAK